MIGKVIVRFLGGNVMRFQVSIDDKAKDVINQKGNLLTISQVSINNCCVPIGEVNIQFKKPDHPERFNKINEGDISLFVDKKLDFKNELIHIRYSGFGPFRTIRIEGVSHF